MAKSLLKQVMLKPVQNKIDSFLNADELIEKIKSGYTIKRVPKFTTKKTFAPSTIAFSHGECPRYWYLAFEGGVFPGYKIQIRFDLKITQMLTVVPT